MILARSGISGSLTLQPGAGTFAVAIVFGYAQYLFTRLVDQQANTVLKSAGSRSDPGITPAMPAGGAAPVLLTTNTASCPQVSGISAHDGPETGGTPVVVTGSGFKTATAVLFGNNAATDVKIDSDSQISLKSPAGKGTVTITVPASVGVSPVSAAALFTYTPVQGAVGGHVQAAGDGVHQPELAAGVP